MALAYLPNHYTLVTGLHPAHHGIVNNSFYDRKLGEIYDRKGDDRYLDAEWYQGQAIWEVAKANGLKAGCFFWVGSEVRGRTPDYYFNFDRKTPIQARLDTFSTWLATDQEPTPDVMCFYFEDVDNRGHYEGISTPLLLHALQFADDLVGKFLAAIEKSGRQVNLIIVADHGMTPLGPVYITNEDIRQAVGEDLEQLVTHYTTVDLFVKNPTPERVAQVLSRLPQKPWLHWYKREDFPWPLHESRNGDIYAYTDPGFQVLKSKGRIIPGGHGYDPSFSDMGAICFGWGPAFQPGSSLGKIEAVDVFPLLLQLAGLPQTPSDGRIEVWDPVLKKKSP